MQRSATRQSSQASASSSTGAPVCSGRKATPVNLPSRSCPEKRRASVSPLPFASTFTAKTPDCSMQPCESAAFSTHTSTRVGSSDTEQTALAVRPQGRPSGRTVVTTVTPEAKWLTTRRNSLVSIIWPGSDDSGKLPRRGRRAGGRFLAGAGPAYGGPAPRSRGPGPQPHASGFCMRALPARARWAPALLILTALSACEKVQWGGAEVRVVQPPPPEGAAPSTPSPAEQTDLGLPRGTVVFHVVRSQGQDRIVPVAEV